MIRTPWAEIALILLSSTGSTSQQLSLAPPKSKGCYRLPFTDGTAARVFDDVSTHRPQGRGDLYAVGGQEPYRVVAAASGRVVAIQDGYYEQQVSHAVVDCHNNSVWIAHPDGEWTNYSHLAQHSVTEGAKLKVGDSVKAGTYLGDEGDVGCAMLKRVHFEVVDPGPGTPIDGGGSLTDNARGKREKDPDFCGIPGGSAVKGVTDNAFPCLSSP
jgi:murein DD-endopeptidase MepM/ murein hydrolase activator NlpD